MSEQFAKSARNVMRRAEQAAFGLNHEYVGTEHVLLGLVLEGSVAAIWEKLRVDPRKIRLECENLVEPGPTLVRAGKLPRTPRTMTVITLAAIEAENNEVGPEHILIGLLREGEGIGAQVLNGLGVKLDDVLTHVAHVEPMKKD